MTWGRFHEIPNKSYPRCLFRKDKMWEWLVAYLYIMNCVYFQDVQYFKMGVPSGIRLHNHGKSPFYSWVNPLFLWPFSIAMLNYQVNPIRSPLNHHKITKFPYVSHYQRVSHLPAAICCFAEIDHPKCTLYVVQIFSDHWGAPCCVEAP